MLFCNNCFIDGELSTVVSQLSKRTGTCPLCGAKDTNIVDTDADDINAFADKIKGLLSIYVQSDEAGHHPIVQELRERWNFLLPSLSDESILEILKACIDDDDPVMLEAVNSNKHVTIPELGMDDFQKEHAIIKNLDWDAFTNELKTRNRYHSKLLNHQILRNFCQYTVKIHHEGECFYRARISRDNAGCTVDEMGAPPPGLSADGRANAKGIRCLYLSCDKETTLHEIRAAEYDYVSIACFQLKRDISVVDLAGISKISPFIDELDFLEYAVNKPFLEKMNAEMSRIVRRSDSELDYVPTQYLVDFIKSLEHEGRPDYEGIEYTSTANKTGVNLAIFEPELFVCVSVDVHEVCSLEYTTKPSVQV